MTARTTARAGVRTLALNDLPGAVASDRTAVRALQSWLQTAPSDAVVRLPGLGEVMLSFERVGDRQTPIGPTDVAFGLQRSGRWGRLGIEGALALRLVSTVLGRAPDLAWRALGRSERGVLAAVVSAALTAVGSDLLLSLAAPPDSPAAAVTLFLRVSVLGRDEPVRLDVPLAWLAERADVDAAGVGALGALPVSGVLELASTNLPRAAWASVRLGDAVVFDGWPPTKGSDPWGTRLRVGPHVADARLDADGAVTLIDAFRPAPPSYPADLHGAVAVAFAEEPSMKDQPPSTSAAPVDATTVLAAAPIELTAVIGRIELRGDEVLGLARGQVLTLGGARTTAVSLCVGGSVWARGELVDVEGELGVRVLEILAR